MHRHALVKTHRVLVVSMRLVCSRDVCAPRAVVLRSSTSELLIAPVPEGAARRAAGSWVGAAASSVGMSGAEWTSHETAAPPQMRSRRMAKRRSSDAASAAKQKRLGLAVGGRCCPEGAVRGWRKP